MAAQVNDVLRALEELRDAEEALARARAAKKRHQDEIDGLNLEIPTLQQRLADSKAAFKAVVNDY